MPIPVLICDDSTFAQKQMARAMPGDWDIDVSFANHGIEALEKIKTNNPLYTLNKDKTNGNNMDIIK